ncbi:MAG TPA: LPS export ABC transporter permease LptG [Alphaproteobacteria bacterium]|nr:LPS export ABC transporter permease LptG [Alphaproteobacteria bacterium]
MTLKTLGRHLFHQHLKYIVITLLFLSGLLLILDLLNNIDDILSTKNNIVWATIEYALLRLPSIMLLMMPFAILLASLLFLSRLSQTQEILAIKAIGVPFYRFLFCLLPAGLSMCLLFFTTSEWLIPYTMVKLQNWEQQSTGTDPKKQPNPISKTAHSLWLKEDNDFIAIDSVRYDGKILDGVRIFIRDPNNIITQQITAQKAEWLNNDWTLQQGQVVHISQTNLGSFSLSVENFVDRLWKTSLRPDYIVQSSLGAEYLSLLKLSDFSKPDFVGANSKYYYESWFYRRIFAPLSCLIMILLASPNAQLIPRRTTLSHNILISIGLGFLYFVLDGILLTFGQTGILQPLLAAIAPLLIFTAIGFWGLIRSDE